MLEQSQTKATDPNLPIRFSSLSRSFVPVLTHIQSEVGQDPITGWDRDERRTANIYISMKKWQKSLTLTASFHSNFSFSSWFKKILKHVKSWNIGSLFTYRLYGNKETWLGCLEMQTSCIKSSNLNIKK